ncbi:MAG: type II toxin-antitoxin system HicA family toxin [Bradyrhizobium sp.]|nr:type II toxin-antitoxin system HicA family toxin [Bradyrhizobium sp.]
MDGYESQVVAILKQHGWQILRRGKGSHDIWVSPSGKKVTVSHGCKSRHTANGILKSAGIKHKF